MPKLASLPRLVPVDAIRPAAYNPRTADEDRLGLVRLSLETLGFLLPIYATPDGDILSGHQRHLVAVKMGATHVPVSYVAQLPLDQYKALNILFNRATNDMRAADTTGGLTRVLLSARVREMAEGLPKLSPEDADFFPVLRMSQELAAPLAEECSGRYDPYAASLADTLFRQFGVEMPVVVSAGMEVLNGVGRVETAIKRGSTRVPCVVLSEQKAKFARLMMNLLTMDFDIGGRYADDLRRNSFRRSSDSRSRLGRAYTFLVTGVDAHANAFDIDRDWTRWVAAYGRSVLDYGCGHGEQAAAVRAKGVEVTEYEPFRILSRTSNLVSRPYSVGRVREFLDAVSAGVHWDTIISSAVWNSIPFSQDRRHVATIMAACADERTKLALQTYSEGRDQLRTAAGGLCTRNDRNWPNNFLAEYESNVVVNVGTEGLIRMQKFFSAAELRSSLVHAWENVKILKGKGDALFALATAPKYSQNELESAIEAMFDAPYPDGGRMGLVGEALAAFRQRGSLC